MDFLVNCVVELGRGLTTSLCVCVYVCKYLKTVIYRRPHGS